MALEPGQLITSYDVIYMLPTPFWPHMMAKPTLDPWRRTQLASMCLQKGKRINGANLQAPSRWWPHRVKHPETFRECTEEQAWEIVSDALVSEVAVSIQPYEKLNGIDAYVMLVDGCDGQKIYIKIAYLAHADKVLGGSFHISERS